jgi:hypothetical protein
MIERFGSLTLCMKEYEYAGKEEFEADPEI